MFEILKLNKISNCINEILAGYKLTEASENPDGIILRSFNMADYSINKGLKCVARAGAGVNNIPIDKMTARGVVVFNTPGANANAVKELVLCAMLLSSRDIIGGNKWVNALPADDTVAAVTEKGKAAFGGTEIFGKTLGIIGAGAIGVLVAEAAYALGMKVLAYDPYFAEENKIRLSGKVEITDCDTIYANADFISLHVPYLPSTKNMINEGAFAKMKNGVIIINMSRAELVDVAALKLAVAESKVRNYVVDFPTAPVLNEKGIIVIPHLGASTDEAEENCAVMAANQLKDYLENGNIVNSVNFPALKKSKTGAVRTCVLYRTEAGVRDSIKAAAKTSDIAYAEMGVSGYMIIDSQKQVAEEIENIIGVIKLFVI